MANQLLEYRLTLEHARTGPLARYVDAFALRLCEQGYATFSIKYRIRLTGALSRWMRRRGLGVRDLDEQTTGKFLQCRGRKRRICLGDAPTLRDLLEHFRQTGVIPAVAPKTDDTEAGRIERSFAAYLVHERGLSDLTVATYLPVVQRFLDDCFSTRPLRIEAIAQADISRFVPRHADTLSRGRAKLMVTALRSFFRFLRMRGDISTDLASAVPTVAGWRLATLPKSIPSEQVEKLLKSCDQSTTTGQRNYTILLLLARLGLRPAEVVAMTLDDIDWEAGEIRVGGKSHREDRLPLPRDVGQALAKYLRHVRPCCSTRRVFVRAKAPLCGFVDSSAVYSLVRRIFDAAQIRPAQRGPYILRHSLATNMLRRGASLAEIGQILRHCDLSTTQIYAKVDLGSLREIAQPWPGDEE